MIIDQRQKIQWTISFFQINTTVKSYAGTQTQTLLVNVTEDNTRPQFLNISTTVSLPQIDPSPNPTMFTVHIVNSHSSSKNSPSAIYIVEPDILTENQFDTVKIKSEFHDIHSKALYVTAPSTNTFKTRPTFCMQNSNQLHRPKITGKL